MIKTEKSVYLDVDNETEDYVRLDIHEHGFCTIVSCLNGFTERMLLTKEILDKAFIELNRDNLKDGSALITVDEVEAH